MTTPAGANTFMLGFLAGLPELMDLSIQGCRTDRMPCPSTGLGRANTAIFKRGFNGS